jgi:hypothetical protein
MPDRDAHALGVVTGRREVAERAASELRRHVAQWRAEDSTTKGLVGAARVALTWALTERWCTRLEALAASWESEALRLRQDEVKRMAAPVAPRKRNWLPWC